MIKRLGLKASVVNIPLIFLVVSLFFTNLWAAEDAASAQEDGVDGTDGREVKAPARYGEVLCKTDGYTCMKIKRGDSWGALFPEERTRDIVKRVNRMNTFLKPGMVIAVPEKIEKKTLYDLAPAETHVTSRGEPMIYIDTHQLAWVAYDKMGDLVRWGPVSVGTGRCPHIEGSCTTPAGEFRVIRKQGKQCVSSAFPEHLYGGHGGAAMPYCIHFYKGYALHGGDALPGRASTHGCVNLFTEDAKWLHDYFVELPGKGHKGTLIVIDRSFPE